MPDTIGVHEVPCQNILYSKRDIIPMWFDIVPAEWYNEFNKGEEALVYGHDVRKRGFCLVGNQHKESYYALLGGQDSRCKQGKWQLADSC